MKERKTRIRQVDIKPDQFGNTNLTEREIAVFVPLSGRPWQAEFGLVNMSEEVAGLRILDIGAGVSDTTCRLLELGADAFAIDPEYESLPTMIGERKKQIREGGEVVPGRKSLNVRTLARFRASVKAFPERYIAAYATGLPFDDDSFDIVYSIFAITSYLNIDFDILRDAVREALRVTKPGGTVRLFPFYGANPSMELGLNQERKKNDMRLLAWLKRQEQISDCQTSITAYKEIKRLIVTKREATPKEPIEE